MCRAGTQFGPVSTRQEKHNVLENSLDVEMSGEYVSPIMCSDKSESQGVIQRFKLYLKLTHHLFLSPKIQNNLNAYATNLQQVDLPRFFRAQ